jgi:hypothetical protein
MGEQVTHPVFVVVADDLYHVDVHLFSAAAPAIDAARKLAFEMSDKIDEKRRDGRLYSAKCPDGEEVFVTMKAIDGPWTD